MPHNKEDKTFVESLEVAKKPALDVALQMKRVWNKEVDVVDESSLLVTQMAILCDIDKRNEDRKRLRIKKILEEDEEEDQENMMKKRRRIKKT